MLSPIKLETLSIDTGKPFVIVELSDETKQGEKVKIFLTRADMECLTKYFEFAETVLAYDDLDMQNM
jgi:hypothetical protein